MQQDMQLYSEPVNYLLSALREDKRIDSLFVFHQLQNLANQFLFLFLNGEYNSRWGYYFPSDRGQERLSNRCWQALNAFSVMCDYLNNSGFSFRESTKNFKEVCGANFFTQGQVAKVISTLYEEIDQNVQFLQRTQYDIPRSLKFDQFAYNTPFLRPVLRLKNYAERHLIPFIHAIYVHGSISTLDYVPGWSDLDTLVVVSKKTLTSPKEILRLKKKLYISRIFLHLIDPLQHHGHFIVTEIDFRYYPQTFFPTVLFKYSKLLAGKHAECVWIRDDSFEKIHFLFRWHNRFREITKRVSQGEVLNPYLFREAIVSRILLLPTLLAQALGEYTYKKYSFDIMRERFSNDIWDIIDICTEIRKKWPLKPINSLWRFLLGINPSYPRTVYFKLYNRGIALKLNTLGYQQDTLARKCEKLGSAALIHAFERLGLDKSYLGQHVHF